MTEAERPLTLLEDAETGNRFIVYTNRDGVALELRFEGEEPWFTQADMAAMFGVTVPTVIEHIQKFMTDGELDVATTRDFLVVRQEGARQVSRPISHYGLDVAFYVGYRVNSSEGKLFRRWATQVLVQVATKGFVIDQRRLKSGGNADRVRELRAIIRDIRSEEANLYAEIQTICSLCQDYDATSKAAREFYRRMQAKIVYAVTSRTPSQVIMNRANSNLPDMGLVSWPGDRILQDDTLVSKNYLAEGEITELNRLTSILLDIFEDQLDIGRLTLMSECTALLDAHLLQLGRVVLDNPGPPGRTVADAHAKAQYKLFNKRRRAELTAAADRELGQLKLALDGLPKPPRRKK